MRELWLYSRAVLQHWVTLMSGLASVGVAIWLDRSKTISLPSVWFWGIALVCVFMGCFLAWRAEHRALLALTNNPDPTAECANPDCRETVPMWAIGDGVLVFTADEWAAKKAGVVPQSRPIPGLCIKCRREAFVNPSPGENVATFWRRERKEKEGASMRGREQVKKDINRQP